MSRITCPGCGLVLDSVDEQLDDRYNASFACRQLYYELAAYNLSLGDVYFIHQLALDTYTVQHIGTGIKPIGLTFALVTLYLVYEHDYTGKQAQKAHTLLAATPKQWPSFQLPEERASLTVLDVLNAPEQERNDMIRQWGRAVWRIWEAEHMRVAEFVQERLAIPRPEKRRSGSRIL